MKLVDATVWRLSEYLQALMQKPEKAVLDLQELPADARVLGERMLSFVHSVLEINYLTRELAGRNLDRVVFPRENELFTPVKGPYALLKHLTWQMQQATQGDYLQACGV